ncbi:CapA family protein [Clostridium sp. OM07-9AC]|nr:CapA family protein [Clostridium sp. OM07-9AC]
MGKIRDWMHGKGRGVVIAVVILLALWIIVDFYRTNHPKPEQKEPAKISEPYEGSSSSSEGNVRTPGDTEDTKNSGLTTTEEDTGTPGEASQIENGDITLGFAGDINLDETWTVMKHMRQKGKGIQGCIDPRLIRKMRSCDYMVLNNEFSISNRGKAMKGKAYTFRAPRRNVKLLQQLGVDAVSLANNHVYDYGERAFLDTLSALENNGIKYTGGGKDSKEAKKPVYFQSKGKTIAVIAATRAEKYILTPAAGKHSPGVFRTYDDTQYVRAIRRAKKKADVVIAFVHWGTEYSTKLESAQTSQAKDYINAGADVVVGAHTHCLQGVGYYKGKPIFYSLGTIGLMKRPYIPHCFC